MHLLSKSFVNQWIVELVTSHQNQASIEFVRQKYATFATNKLCHQNVSSFQGIQKVRIFYSVESSFSSNINAYTVVEFSVKIWRILKSPSYSKIQERDMIKRLLHTWLTRSRLYLQCTYRMYSEGGVEIEPPTYGVIFLLYLSPEFYCSTG